MDLATGQILRDRYRIVNKLAQGGFGAVYRAWDMNLRAHCAVKENLKDGEAIREQFLREAKILAQLTHPHLPRVTDYFILPGMGQYLVMDYIEGMDLQQMLDEKNEPLPLNKAMEWIYQVSDAVMYLHTQMPPIIHRDIKPANIKVTPDGRAVLVDFGIAKVFEEKSETLVGAKAITPGYSPPEQYGRGATDVRSDVYSLGATLYALITGEVPPSSVDIISKTSPPPSPAQMVNPAVPTQVSEATARAMQMEKQARFANVAAFRDALAQPSQPVAAAALVGAAAVVQPAAVAQPAAYTPPPANQPPAYNQPPAAPPGAYGPPPPQYPPGYGAGPPEPKPNRMPWIIVAGLLGIICIAVMLVLGIWLGNSDIIADLVGEDPTQTPTEVVLADTPTSPPVLEPTATLAPDEPTPVEPAPTDALPTDAPEATTPPEPTIPPTPTMPEGPIMLMDIADVEYMFPSEKGCFELANQCWVNKPDTEEKTIRIFSFYVDPAWPNPWLAFEQTFSLPDGVSATLKINGELIITYTGQKSWFLEKYSLAEYAGQEIEIELTFPWGMTETVRKRKNLGGGSWTYEDVDVTHFTEWTIQELMIDPDY